MRTRVAAWGREGTDVLVEHGVDECAACLFVHRHVEVTEGGVIFLLVEGAEGLREVECADPGEWILEEGQRRVLRPMHLLCRATTEAEARAAMLAHCDA